MNLDAAGRPPIPAEAFRGLTIAPIPEDEVRRHLGYPAAAAPRPAIARRIREVTAEAVGLLEPRGAYALYPVEARSPRRLVLSSAVVRGEVARFLGAADRVAVIVATAGAAVTRLSERYAADGDSLGAWIADAVGSCAAEAAADAVTARVAGGLSPADALTLRYSPGYCGMAMSQQQVLFGLVDAAAAGIELLPSMLMRPLKSVSGIVGIGPASDLPSKPLSACDACARVGCHMRR